MQEFVPCIAYLSRNLLTSISRVLLQLQSLEHPHHFYPIHNSISGCRLSGLPKRTLYPRLHSRFTAAPFSMMNIRKWESHRKFPVDNITFFLPSDYIYHWPSSFSYNLVHGWFSNTETSMPSLWTIFSARAILMLHKSSRKRPIFNLESRFKISRIV